MKTIRIRANRVNTLRLVREKSKQLCELIMDDAKLLEERENAKQLKKKL